MEKEENFATNHANGTRSRNCNRHI